jgi:taurine--2-oxoglutarate transaminase
MRTSSAISQTYQDHLLHSWSRLDGYNPIEVTHTKGCYLFTKDGRKIFDLRSAHECANIGFNHPFVLEAMQRQLEYCTYVTDDFSTKATAQLVDKLCTLAPGNDNKRIWFGQSGAAAVEAAIKAARFYKYSQVFLQNSEKTDFTTYPYPYKIISRYRSWHGSTAGALSASGDPRRWFAEPIVQPGIVFGPDVYPYRSHFENDEDGLKSVAYLRHMVEMEGGRDYVAAVLVEPVVGSNGIIPAPKPYVKAIRELCDDFDLVMIVDETMTGMGRTGTFLAIEQYDVEPDIIIMGKALGMYCPLSAAIFNEKVWKTFEKMPFGHGQSYAGHALACAAALASIQVIENENLLQHTREMGAYLHEKLLGLGTRHESVGEVRGLGLMYTVELVLNKTTKTPIRKANQKYHDNPVRDIAAFLLNEKNIYVPGDKFGLWITPPLTVTKDEIDMLIEAFDEALSITDKAAVKFNEDY